MAVESSVRQTGTGGPTTSNNLEWYNLLDIPERSGDW